MKKDNLFSRGTQIEIHLRGFRLPATILNAEPDAPSTPTADSYTLIVEVDIPKILDSTIDQLPEETP